MAETYLNTTTSIVDYLKSKGQDSSFPARKKLYEESGLADRLGQYTGSEFQNPALLKQLNTPTPTPTPTPTTPTETPPPTGVTATGAVETAGGGDESGFGSIKSPEFNATSFMEQFNKIPSASDALAQVESSPQFKLSKERNEAQIALSTAESEAQKAQLSTQFAQDVEAYKRKFEQAGLFFSGDLGVQIKSLSDTLAASSLGVDRKLAGILLDANFDMRKQVLTDVEQIINTAIGQNDKARESALKQLNEAGLTIVGNKLVPTLEAQKEFFDQNMAMMKEARESRNMELTQKLALASFDQRLNEFDALNTQRNALNAMSIERLKIAQTNAYTSQERNAILNQIREINLMNMTAVSPGQVVNAQNGLPAKLTDVQRTRYAGYDQFINYFVPNIQTLINKVPTGGAVGRLMTTVQDKPVGQRGLNQDQEQFLVMLVDMNNTLLYLRSGKQINEQEFERLKATLPSPNKTNEQNRIDTTTFYNTMKSAYERELKISGYTIASGVATDVNVLSEVADNAEAELGDEEAYQLYLQESQ